MTITPALILDIVLIGVIVATVIHYARKGFVAGVVDLVGNLIRTMSKINAGVIVMGRSSFL